MSFRIELIQRLIHFNESLIFYPKLRKFYLKKLNNKTIKIIDIGANRGQSIEFFLELNVSAKIESFEPNKDLYILLKNKYENNSNIKLHNYGVSNFNGELLFNENVLNETSSFEKLNSNSKYLKFKANILGVSPEDIVNNKYKVKVVKLIDFLKSKTNIIFDVLKIDVEGHELKVLQGLFEKNLENIPIRFIQLESHKDDMYLIENDEKLIDDMLIENKFILVKEIQHGFGKFTEKIYENLNLKRKN